MGHFSSQDCSWRRLEGEHSSWFLASQYLVMCFPREPRPSCAELWMECAESRILPRFSSTSSPWELSTLLCNVPAAGDSRLIF